MELSVDIAYKIRWPKELIERRTQYMIDTTGNEVVRGIRRNISEQVSIMGGHFRKLKPATIRRKRGMRYPSQALYALGILYRAIHYYKTGENAGAVGIMIRGKPSRRDVAEYQQTGAYRGGVARRFFGISKQLRQSKLIPMWRAWFDEKIRRAELYKSGTI